MRDSAPDIDRPSQREATVIVNGVSNYFPYIRQLNCGEMHFTQ